MTLCVSTELRMNRHLMQLAGTVDVKVKQSKANHVLPLLVCLIFGLSIAVIARPHTLLSACSCTSKHPTPVSPSACASLPLSSSSSLSDLLQCGRQLGGWVNRGGEENGKRRGWWRKKEEELPLFFPLSVHTRSVASTPPCYIIHSGTCAWGWWRRRFLVKVSHQQNAHLTS